MGVRSSVEETEGLLEECIREAEGACSGRVCYGRSPVRLWENGAELVIGRVESRLLAERLQGCDEAVVFAATVGIGIDRLIARYSRLSPAKALCFQALGAERIEALCDVFCEDVLQEAAKEGRTATSRFSPGYGDLPLDLQASIFRLLDCPKRIGVTLNVSRLMSPTKSVTAIVGLRKEGL